jgi:hypothetical protein
MEIARLAPLAASFRSQVCEPTNVNSSRSGRGRHRAELPPHGVVLGGDGEAPVDQQFVTRHGFLYAFNHDVPSADPIVDSASQVLRVGDFIANTELVLWGSIE